MCPLQMLDDEIVADLKSSLTYLDETEWMFVAGADWKNKKDE
jgi:hypothetical protein